MKMAYEAGLRTSWFIVTGTIGLLMVMIVSLVASASMVKKGVKLEVLYPNLLATTAFTLVIVGASVWRFRKQLS